MTKKKRATAAWQDSLKALSERLRDQDLISSEQVGTLASVADQLEHFGEIDPGLALSLTATAYSAVEFERLSRQQAEAAGMLAWVRSALPLTDEQRGLLKRRLRERFGQDFVLRVEVDPSLIGGLVVKARDQVFDGSVAGRLEALGKQLQTAVEEQRAPAAELREPGE